MGASGGETVPSSGSGRASLFAAVAATAATVFLLRIGSGHTAESRGFAGRPEYAVWMWLYALEVGAAAAFGLATWPAFRQLVRAAGRSAAVQAVGVWLVVGALIVIFGPRSGGHLPLWLGYQRSTAVNLLAGVFITPSVAGLLLVQVRLADLRAHVTAAVDAGLPGHLIADLLWLRSAMQRFLVTFAVLITLGVLALGALRLALLANGASADTVPAIRVLNYGGFLTATTAVLFVPAYVTWQERVFELRDALYPIPPNGTPDHDWHQARADFDTLTSARTSVGTVLTATFSILAPLAGSLVTTLLPVN